jgi:hypothetical protein
MLYKTKNKAKSMATVKDKNIISRIISFYQRLTISAYRRRAYHDTGTKSNIK